MQNGITEVMILNAAGTFSPNTFEEMFSIKNDIKEHLKHWILYQLIQWFFPSFIQSHRLVVPAEPSLVGVELSLNLWHVTLNHVLCCNQVYFNFLACFLFFLCIVSILSLRYLYLLLCLSVCPFSIALCSHS